MKINLKKSTLIAILAGTILFFGMTMTASADATTDATTASSLIAQLSCKEDWVTCLANVPMLIPMYLAYAVFSVASMLLTGAAYIFDAVLALSIDKVFLNQKFITTIWGIILSFTNMVFIFILLYTGIQTILGLGNWQKTVIKVVIIALLINFSLFFTKVVIDAGNVLAVGMYSAMGSPSTTPHTKGGIPERNLSYSIATYFQPQTFMKITADTKLSAMEITVLFVIGTLVNIFAALAFFQVAVVFIGRIIGFWFLMIISPFAFISITFPQGNQFQKWLKNLLGLSFVAPVFLFFLYIIIKILGEGGLLNSFLRPNTATVGTFTFDTIFIPTITVIFVYLALNKAIGLAKSMSGSFGELGEKIVGAVGGFTALTGAKLAQKTVGGLAYKASQSETFKRMASSNSIGRVAYNLNEKVAGGNWDIRNTRAGGNLGLGKGTESNYAKTVSDAKAKDIAFGKKVTVDENGKPLIVKDASGNDITAAQAYQTQLEKGYLSRTGTGGNVGAKEAAKVVGKGEKNREKLDAEKKAIIAKFRVDLGIPGDTRDIDDPTITALAETRRDTLETLEADAESNMAAATAGTPAHKAAIVAKKRATRNLNEFTEARSKVKQINKDLKEATA